MIKACRLTALLPFLCLAALAPKATAIDLDLGLRASIYDENYKLGVGGELGVIMPATAAIDLGLHLNYTNFRAKTETFVDATELGGYVTAYFHPAIDQGFSLRLGPHIGYSALGNSDNRESYLDLGGDVMAVFQATPMFSFYAAFIPSFLIGPDSQSLIRIGLGLQYSMGK
jgi:hypothetical protein